MIAIHRAVPRVGLLLQEPAGRLALDRATFGHLQAWLEQVARLPADTSPLSADTRKAIASLREALPPEGLTAGVLQVVRRLQEGAATMAATLRRLGRPEAAWKEGLLQLGRIAQDSRSGISSIASELRSFVPPLVRANGELATALAADADGLRKAYEALGALQARIAQAERDVRKQGFLASLSRPSAAEKKLQALQEQLALESQQAEDLRQAVASVALVIDEAGWVEPALGALASFVEQAQKAWTQVGSGVAQVAADASAAQLEDAAWRENALGAQQATAQWQAIALAAQAFIASVPAGWAAKVLHEEQPS